MAIRQIRVRRRAIAGLLWDLQIDWEVDRFGNFKLRKGGMVGNCARWWRFSGLQGLHAMLVLHGEAFDTVFSTVNGVYVMVV